MGGAVRFILAKPGLTEYSGSARTEVGFTEGGDWSREVGGAIGGPIVENKIGFRASAYHRHDGGYIDRVPFYANRGTPEKDSNSRDVLVGNASLSFEPTEFSIRESIETTPISSGPGNPDPRGSRCLTSPTPRVLHRGARTKPFSIRSTLNTSQAASA
jgi:hypothetical protein